MNDANRNQADDATTWNYAHAAVQRLNEDDPDDLVADGGQTTTDLDLTDHLVDEEPDVTVDAMTANMLLCVADVVLDDAPAGVMPPEDTVQDARDTMAGAVETAETQWRREQIKQDAAQAEERAGRAARQRKARQRAHNGAQFSLNLGFLRNESPDAAKHLVAASYALAGNEHAKASRELKKAARHIGGMAE